MNERSASVCLVRLGLLAYQLLLGMPPRIVSHTRLLPAIMWVQPVDGQSYLYISYGKTKLSVSTVHPPVADDWLPVGPDVLTAKLPFWLSWYHLWPCTGSMRANM